MNIRLYQAADNTILRCLFSDTVRHVNVADYSAEQVEVWAASPPDLECWIAARTGRIVLVAEDNSKLVGFATLEPDGHIDHLYVHHEFQEKGVASALLRRIEQQAISCNIRRVFTEASITACGFFERKGFRIITSQVVALKGIDFLNFRMEKLLS